MRIASILENDLTKIGPCVTIRVQGCPIHCSKCYDQDTWDFKGGLKAEPTLVANILQLLDIHRDLYIQGGEPLCNENAFYVYKLIREIKDKRPDIKIYIRSGYTYDQLLKFDNQYILGCLELCDVLTTGPHFEQHKNMFILI